MQRKNSNVVNSLKRAGIILLEPLVSIVFALLVGAVIIAALGNDVGKAYQALLTGAFGNIRAISQTLLAATPLMFTAMAFAMAFRSGLFNLGAEGQFYIGAILGAWMGFAIPGLPPILHVMVVVLAGAVGGMIVAFVPAFLKAKLGVHEVIICIMMNYLAKNITNYLVNSDGPLRLDSVMPATPMVQESAKLPVLIEGTRLTGGFIIAIIIAVMFFIFLWKTRTGYKIRAVGFNPFAAECGGIKSVKYTMMAMLLAGAFAGIGGSVEIIGVHSRFYANFSPGYGFEGVAVGMLGRNHPFGILLSALLFGALKTGAMAMQIQAGTNAELVKVLQALVIFFIAARWGIPAIAAYFKGRKQTKKALSSEQQ